MKKDLSKIPSWKHCGTTEESSDFEVNGLRVWQHQWRSVRGEGGSVYRIEAHGKTQAFKAEEVRSGVWSFWTRNTPN